MPSGSPQVVDLDRPIPTGRERRRLFCHLTIAAEQLARETADALKASQYQRVASRFRDLASDTLLHASNGPLVPTQAGAGVPLIALLKQAWQERGLTTSSHDVSLELLDAARELLQALNLCLASDPVCDLHTGA